MPMTAESAAQMGAKALLFLAEQPDHMGAFLAESGASVDDLRASAADPQILGYVLAHIAAREELAEEFCRGENLGPEELAAAQAALLGQETHWT